MRVPKRGDIWHINLNPTQGSEQQGQRPVLIVSDKAFNQAGLIWVCPITQGGQYARFAGFSVSLINCGTQTQGIIACHQIRTLDYQARHATFIETVPSYLIEEVLARLQAVLE